MAPEMLEKVIKNILSNYPVVGSVVLETLPVRSHEQILKLIELGETLKTEKLSLTITFEKG